MSNLKELLAEAARLCAEGSEIPEDLRLQIAARVGPVLPPVQRSTRFVIRGKIIEATAAIPPAPESAVSTEWPATPGPRKESTRFVIRRRGLNSSSR